MDRGWTQFFGADLARWVPKIMDATQNQILGCIQMSVEDRNVGRNSKCRIWIPDTRTGSWIQGPDSRYKDLNPGYKGLGGSRGKGGVAVQGSPPGADYPSYINMSVVLHVHIYTPW